MREIKSCGVIVFRREPVLSFLLMKHPTRWDLPKGHVDPGESELQCALRELQEETGITADQIEVDPTFRYVTHYQVRDKRFPHELADKTLLIFLAWLKHDVPIAVSEHVGYQWFAWDAPHHIQPFTIDPLLAALQKYFKS